MSTRSAMRALQRAFTLIELLVVIVIVGIVLSIASLSVGVLGRDNQLEEQARRLDAVIAQVREESELQGRDVGLLVERNGYFFMRYDYQTQRWQQMENDPLIEYRELPAGLQTRLWLDGREVILKTHEENQRLLQREQDDASSASSSSSSSSSSIARLTDAPKNALAPQIFLLSSGDISPFELRLEREGSDFSWHLLAKADNTVTVEISDAAK